MNLLEMSVSGAVMILAVIVVRALAINRLPKKTFIALWGIVLLRLLLPFSLPSQFSAFSFMSNYSLVPQKAATPLSTALSTLTEGLTKGATTAFSPYMVIWGIGIIACGLFFGVSYFKCRSEFRESLPIKNDFLEKWLAEHKLARSIEIRQSDRVSAPLTYGIFKPVILMPKNTDWENTKQTEYILAHEFIHIKRFDAVIKLLLTVALCVHWFNPLVWAMYVLSNRDIELSCDETVILMFGDTTKSAYARTLISMEENKNKFTPLCNNFSKNSIEERITAIMKMKKTSLAALLVAVLLIAGMTAVFATSAADSSPQLDDTTANDKEKRVWLYDDEKDVFTTELTDGGELTVYPIYENRID